MIAIALQAGLAFLGLYLLLVGAMALGQRGMIYHPDPIKADPEDAGVPEMVPIPLRADDGWPGGGWYAPPKGADKPTVLFFHGNSGTIGSRGFKGRALLDAGFGVFMLEYRGYGGMPGQPSEQGLFADARAAARWLLSRGVPTGRIVLYGESLGAAVAMSLTEHLDPMLVILECPFTSIPDLAPAYILSPLARMFITDRYDNLSRIGSLRAPLLIIHGELDEVVPPDQARALLEAAGSEAKDGLFLPNAAHNNLWDHGAGEKIVEFIARRGR